MKAYTDIEKSKKLAEILPVESADMRWYYKYNDGDKPQLSICNFSKYYIPCWSLAALLNVLPKRYNDDTVYIPLVGRYYEGKKFICGYFGDGLLDWTFGETPVDACVAMIEKLHEQNLL